MFWRLITQLSYRDGHQAARAQAAWL